LSEIYDLEAVAELLYWDQATYMPPKAVAARSRQFARLKALAHERKTDPALGRLLDRLEPYAETLPHDADEGALIRVARRDFEQARRVPAAFTEAFYAHTARTYELWTEARPKNDFARLLPALEKTLEMSRRYAEFFPEAAHPADPLIDRADHGMKTETLRALFRELRQRLVPLVRAITSQPRPDCAFLHRHYPREAQLRFGEAVIRKLGYDFERGRQDLTHHPFMIKFSLDDVRITTRVKEDDLTEALFGTIHEAGHAMYEQGIAPGYEGTPLADGASMGLHESQSRLWENIVGRSLPFWRHFYPQLQAAFPEQLRDVSLEAFHRAINCVSPSLIRTDADEVTYNLHIMLRFDLEVELLEGGLALAELPDAWNARFQEDFGLEVPNHADGVLQDMHWFIDFIGGQFQSYTLGNLMSAQLFAAAVKAEPGIPEAMAQGDFTPLRAWLRDEIHRHGRKYTAAELIEAATGQPMSIEPFMNYLYEKYRTLYEF
ncbi:MAG: carboxypeptidase M32, partial [Deltaproteobacteria bacterium]